jgi:6-pyruvoyltetrahydropterin/6-carboxytetrahydropterin synthase
VCDCGWRRNVPAESSFGPAENLTVSLKIMRRVTFCAGHRLLGHEGKCNNLHGHNYVAEFHVTGQQQDEIGRILDFKLLKDKCKGWLDEHWDHAFLLWERDENALAAVRSCEPHRIYELPYNPTAENLARYLLEEVCPKLLSGTGATAQRIVIWESEESYAEVSLSSPATTEGSSRLAATIS